MSPEGEPAPSSFVTFYRWVNYIESEKNSDHKLISAAFGKPTAPLDADLLQAFRSYWNLFPDTASLPYTDSAGAWDFRKIMAEALTLQYDNVVKISPEHILFTVGGSGALQASFAAIKHLHPHGKIVVISPYYPQYHVLYGGAATMLSILSM